MVTARRLTLSTVAVLGIAILLAPAPIPDAPDNWQRLQGMPPELRLQLADQLKAFDLLDRKEKDAIRALDQKIAAEPDENRQLYYGVLQRYHAWIQGLSETQRNELSAVPPEKRLALVTKILADRKTKSSEKAEPSFFHYADFGGASPFELAERIKVWMLLSDAEKAEIAKLDPADRSKRLTQLIHEKKIHIPRPPASQVDVIYKRALDSGRFPFLKKADATKKQAIIKRRFVDSYWFVDHVPTKVSPDKLLQFEQSLPAWIRSGLDPLPPEEARRRLTILYRLIYPTGEIKAPVQAVTKPAPAPAPAPPATPKTATPNY